MTDGSGSSSAGQTRKVVRAGETEVDRRREREHEPRRTRHLNLLGAAAALIVFLVDQGSKAAAFANVARSGDWVVAPFLTITSGWNTGIAFGVAALAEPSSLILVALAISTLLAILLVRSTSAVEKFAFGSIIGGALSNVADRVRFGAVRDYIDLHWASWRWPTFNLADAFIAAGVVALLIASTRGAKVGR